MPDGAILVVDPRDLLRPKGAPDKLDEPGGVPRNDPRRDRVIALRYSRISAPELLISDTTNSFLRNKLFRSIILERNVLFHI